MAPASAEACLVGGLYLPVGASSSRPRATFCELPGACAGPAPSAALIQATTTFGRNGQVVQRVGGHHERARVAASVAVGRDYFAVWIDKAVDAR
jgi:hypothetical protein